jgi:hypothetical protein
MKKLNQQQVNKGVCHTVNLAISIKKVSEGKRRNMETQIFHHPKI